MINVAIDINELAKVIQIEVFEDIKALRASVLRLST